MKTKIFPIFAMVLLALCSCKGRTASVPEADGDTIEVIVNHTDEAEGIDSMAADKGALTPDSEELRFDKVAD